MTTRIAPEIEVGRVRGLSELGTLEGAWHELEGRCSGLTVFSSWEWCSTVAHYYGGERPLWVFSMRDNGRLVGLAPLARTRLGPGLRALRHVGCGLGRASYADYQDLLIADGYEQDVTEALCRELEEASAGWDVVHLQELPRSSRTIVPLLAAAQRRGWPTVVRMGSDVHPLPLPDSWEVYRLRLSAKTRGRIERRERKVVRERGAEFTHVEDEGAVDEAMEALFDLHTRRWEAAGKAGIFRDDHKRAFHKEIARRLLRRGALRLTILKASGRPVGAIYSFAWNGTKYYYASGFSPGAEWSPYGLGTTLDAHEIRGAMEEGLRGFDFLRGDPEYKAHYRAKTEYNREVFIFRDRRAQLHYGALRLARGAAARLRRLASRGNGLRPGRLT